MFSLICVWINDCVNNREAGDLRRYRSHYDVMVMNFHYAEPTNAWALENKHSNEFQTSVMTKGHFNKSFCCYKISHKFILYSGLCILETTILKKTIIKSKKKTQQKPPSWTNTLITIRVYLFNFAFSRSYNDFLVLFQCCEMYIRVQFRDVKFLSDSTKDFKQNKFLFWVTRT